MPPARAADRDRQVRLALAPVEGQEELQQVPEPLEELAALGVLEDELVHPLVAPVERPEPGDEVRVREEADVEDQIGVVGDAVLVPEGDQRRRQPRAGLPRPVELDELVLELVDGERGRVDDPVGDLPELGQRLALGADAVEDVAVRRERMLAPRLVVPAHQRLVARLQEEHLHRVVAATQLAEPLHQMRQVLAFPHVDPERDVPDVSRRPRRQLGERRDQGRRQVVDAEVADILEALDREALAGAAEPGDDDVGDRPAGCGHAPALRRAPTAAAGRAGAGATAGSPAPPGISPPSGARWSGRVPSGSGRLPGRRGVCWCPRSRGGPGSSS